MSPSSADSEKNQQGNLENITGNLTGDVNDIQKVLKQKRAEKNEKIEDENNKEQERIAKLRVKFESDERYIQIRETLLHPNLNAIMRELQAYVESSIEEGIAKWEKSDSSPSAVTIQNGRRIKAKTTGEKFLEHYGIDDRKWKEYTWLPEIYSSDEKIEERRFAGSRALILEGRYPSHFGTAWRIDIAVGWDTENRKLTMNLTPANQQTKLIKNFDQLLDVVAEEMAKEPVFWEKEIKDWLESITGGDNLAPGKLKEAWSLFTEVYYQKTKKHITTYPLSFDFYHLNQEGNFREIMSIVKVIDTQLEGTRLLRQIAGNTRSIATNSTVTAVGTVALAKLTAQNSQLLESINQRILALGEKTK